MFLIFILLAAISAYRDLARYVIKGVWKKESVNVKVWGKATGTDDSFHQAGGLMWAMIIALMLLQTEVFKIPMLMVRVSPDQWLLFWLVLLVHGAVYWQFFYWIRNIFMHVLFRTKDYRKPEYWNPFRWLFKS